MMYFNLLIALAFFIGFGFGYAACLLFSVL